MFRSKRHGIVLLLTKGSANSATAELLLQLTRKELWMEKRKQSKCRIAMLFWGGIPEASWAALFWTIVESFYLVQLQRTKLYSPIGNGLHGRADRFSKSLHVFIRKTHCVEKSPRRSKPFFGGNHHRENSAVAVPLAEKVWPARGDHHWAPWPLLGEVTSCSDGVLFSAGGPGVYGQKGDWLFKFSQRYYSHRMQEESSSLLLHFSFSTFSILNYFPSHSKRFRLLCHQKLIRRQHFGNFESE